jgi:hypothetical protein
MNWMLLSGAVFWDTHGLQLALVTDTRQTFRRSTSSRWRIGLDYIVRTGQQRADALSRFSFQFPLT